MLDAGAGLFNPSVAKGDDQGPGYSGLEPEADPGADDDSVIDVAGATGFPDVLDGWLDVEAGNDLYAVREFVYRFKVLVLAKRAAIFIAEPAMGSVKEGMVMRPRGKQALVDGADTGLERRLRDFILTGPGQ